MTPPARSLADVPGAPPPGSVLCRVSELGPREARAFQFREGHFRYEIFVQRWDDAVYVYRDSCPHLRLPLDYRHGVYLDREERHIRCAHHGALFRVHDGYCVDGPCKGRYLTPIAVERRGDDLVIA